MRARIPHFPGRSVGRLVGRMYAEGRTGLCVRTISPPSSSFGYASPVTPTSKSGPTSPPENSPGVIPPRQEDGFILPGSGREPHSPHSSHVSVKSMSFSNGREGGPRPLGWGWGRGGRRHCTEWSGLLLAFDRAPGNIEGNKVKSNQDNSVLL